MSSHNPPLTCPQVKRILRNLGFTPRPKKAGRGSHENWVKQNPFRKVTVDCPKQPFSQDLIKSMAAQAGVSKRQFYAALDKKQARKVLDRLKAQHDRIQDPSHAEKDPDI